MALADPMDRVRQMGPTAGSVEMAPIMPVTTTMISPDVSTVCMDPSYAAFF